MSHKSRSNYMLGWCSLTDCVSRGIGCDECIIYHGKRSKYISGKELDEQGEADSNQGLAQASELHGAGEHVTRIQGFNHKHDI
jgi:hypothetical protein